MTQNKFKIRKIKGSLVMINKIRSKVVFPKKQKN